MNACAVRRPSATTRIASAVLWCGIAVSALLCTTRVAAQLVTLQSESHFTTTHSYPEVRQTVVWVIKADREISAFHVRLIDPNVTLEKSVPPGIYLWSLPSWNFGSDPDQRGITGLFRGDSEFPPRREAYFGIEYAPDAALTAALLQARTTYEIQGVTHEFSVIPEPATYAFGAWVLIALLMAGRRLRQSRPLAC